MVRNITFVTQYFAPAWAYGGPPKVLYTLAKQLVNLGKNVKLITSDVLNERRNTNLCEVLDKIEIYRYKTVSNVLSYKMKLIYIPDILIKSKKILDESDFVIFSDIRAIINWQLYPYVSKRNIPYGIFAFGEIPYGGDIKSNIKKIFDNWWVKDFIDKASLRFAQTEHEREMYQKYFSVPRRKTQIIPLPVEGIETDYDESVLDAWKIRWNIQNKDRVLLFVGRLNYLKGLDLLIRALKPVMKKNKHLKLLIVGRDDGEGANLRKLIEKGLENQLIFSGPLYEKDVACAYRASACFILTPRHFEETSLASLEALSCGIPVIVSHEAEIPYLEKYGAGFIIENTPDAIRKSVLRIVRITDRERDEIMFKAKKLIKEKFSPVSVTGKVMNIMESA